MSDLDRILFSNSFACVEDWGGGHQSPRYGPGVHALGAHGHVIAAHSCQLIGHYSLAKRVPLGTLTL